MLRASLGICHRRGSGRGGRNVPTPLKRALRLRSADLATLRTNGGIVTRLIAIGTGASYHGQLPQERGSRTTVNCHWNGGIAPRSTAIENGENRTAVN